MKVKLEILVIIGLMVGLFATVIPFADILTEVIEDRIYFRLVLIAGLFISIFSAVNFKGFYQNSAISLGSGIVAVLIMSTYNLLCDVCIDTYNYYKFTLITVLVVLFILTILRLFWNEIHTAALFILTRLRLCLDRLLRRTN